MQVNYAKPCTILEDMLSVYCEVRGAGVPMSDTVPALLGQVHVFLSGGAEFEFADGRRVAAPQVALCGPFTQAFRFHLSGDLHMIGMGLLPVGWESLLGMAAGSLADTVVDAAAIWPASTLASLLDQLHGAADLSAAATTLDQFVLTRMAASTRDVDPRTAMIEHWLEHSKALSLADLGAALDLSPRQLGRLTVETHGASPKLLSMKYRALRSAAMLTLHKDNALNDAIASYADQAHFIRDFRRFVGWTPGVFLKDRHHLARVTMEGRWNVGARRSLALWS
jgi:AraC-like DNA-binding protein